MLDTKVLPDFIISDLKDRGHSEDDISRMTPRNAFNEYCNWNGLINHGDSLWEVVQALKDSDCGEQIEVVANVLNSYDTLVAENKKLKAQIDSAISCVHNSHEDDMGYEVLCALGVEC